MAVHLQPVGGMPHDDEFLTPLGVPTEQAVALGLVLYALNLVMSLVGAPAFAMGSRRNAVV